MADPNLTDLWTNSEPYARLYQDEDEVDTVLELLDLERARLMVDSGCGNGTFAIAAASRHSKCRVHAYDALQSAVDECRSRAGTLLEANLEVGVAAAHEIPLPGNSADRVLSRFVLHHIENAPALLLEVRRILEPGGLFLLQTPCNNWEPAMSDAMQEISLAMDGSHTRYYHLPEQITGMLIDAGFKVATPDLQRFYFPFLSGEAAAVVTKLGLQDKLKLRQVDDVTWAVDLWWFRILARATQ